ncbi:MAG: ADP-ribosylglycohydrolase family protein [Desulforhopalus sp.]
MEKQAQTMVLASFAADSLALGAHWIYDTEKIDQQLGRITTLRAPLEGSHHPTKKRGDFTHYGDQSLHLLEYLAAQGGHFDVTEYSREWQSFIEQYPGFMDHATKDTLKNLKAGKEPTTCCSESTDLGGPARIAPLIYCYRENLDEMLAAITALTTFTHCGPGVLDGALFLARSCYEILHGSTPREAFGLALELTRDTPDLDLRLRKCLESTQQDSRRQIKEFGQMCATNAALPGAVYAVLKNEDNIEEALIETVMAGGDSAARGMAVGMILGAYHSKNSIPSSWIEKLTMLNRIKSAFGKLP